MSYTINGETIKLLLCSEIAKIFPDVICSKEKIGEDSVTYPYFLVTQQSITKSEGRKNRWSLDYSFNIQYIISSTPSSEGNLQERLDGVGLKLLSELNTINIEGFEVGITEAKYEKEDGILNYFCNIIIQVTKERLDAAKMQELELNIKL